MIFALYLTRMFTVRFLAALLALAALAQMVDLMERADEIIARGLGVAGMARAAVLRLPLAAGPVVPIAALAAALLTFAALAWRGEISAMRASGLALARLVGWLLPAGVLAAGLGFVLADRVAPAADAAFAAWWAATDPAPPEAGRLWFRAGPDVAGARPVGAVPTSMAEVVVYGRDGEGVLVETVEAPRAEWRNGVWILRDATLRPAGEAARPVAEWVWRHGVPPRNMAELARPLPLHSSARLAEILAGRWAGRDSPQSYRLRLHRAFAHSLSPMVMILLATPVAGRLRRGGGIPAGMAVGLAAGLSYLVLDGILAALGEAGTLPPWLAAWLPHALFASVGGTMLLYAEG